MAQASSRPLTANSIALLAPRDFVELMAPALSENDLADQTGRRCCYGSLDTK